MIGIHNCPLLSDFNGFFIWQDDTIGISLDIPSVQERFFSTSHIGRLNLLRLWPKDAVTHLGNRDATFLAQRLLGFLC